MPGGDRRGPEGAGPMTGRGAGFCSGNDQPGYMSSGTGRGMAMRRGGGFGARRMDRFIPRPGGIGRGGRFGGYGMNRGYRGYAERVPAADTAAAAAEERSMLAAEAEMLQRELDAIRKRIDSIDGGKK